jgi:hypothetical protein
MVIGKRERSATHHFTLPAARFPTMVQAASGAFFTGA